MGFLDTRIWIGGWIAWVGYNLGRDIEAGDDPTWYAALLGFWLFAAVVTDLVEDD